MDAIARLLGDFLDRPERPDRVFEHYELQGFRFANASSQETIPPSERVGSMSDG